MRAGLDDTILVGVLHAHETQVINDKVPHLCLIRIVMGQMLVAGLRRAGRQK
jgi:hypothetical protein